MKAYNLKDMVKDGKKATFVKYRNGLLIYRTECGFEFPVPTSDLGEADMHNEERAMLLMKYIRKHIANIEKGEVAAQEAELVS